MTNLFSTFDPSTGNFSMNWASTMIIIMLYPRNFWILPNKSLNLMSTLMKTLFKEMKTLMPYKGTFIISTSLFMMIMYNNIMGLMPYVFTASVHLVFTVTMALPMWMSMMIYGWLFKTNNMLAHMLPTGTPKILMPIMIIIETLSNLIRPGSLSVRLTANMIAGHLFMSLLGNKTDIMMPLMLMLMVMMMFEFSVCMIQSYVFMTLSTLYSSEI